MILRLIFALVVLIPSLAFGQTDWSKPNNSSTKTNFPIEIRQLAYQAMKMDATQYDTAVNLPTNAVQYNRTTDQLEEWNGSSWSTAPIGVPTGSIIQQFATTAPTGYLLLAGGTIGNASSGATLRANADCAALFSHLWTNLTNTEAPVSSGRGASAAADFAANKTLTVPDMRQRFPIGKAASGTGSTLGGTGGTVDHNHSITHTHNMANHTHTMGNHTHTITHTHNMGNHTHSTPAHTHSAGNLRAQIGVNLGDAAAGIRMSLDGVNTFTSGYKWSASSPSFSAESTSGHPTSVVQGSTANDGSGTSGGPSTNTTDGTNTASSGGPSTNTSDGPSTNVTDGTNTANSGTANPPFLAMNFFIKY